jgi:branched-chain amino acid transport system permease protein
MMKVRRSVLIASIILALLLVTVPLFAPTFFVVQIGIQSLFLGIVALSLIFLAGYGGMVSLVQVALYGVAGYVYAILTVTYNAPWYVGVLVGLLFTTVLSTLFSLVAIRTQGIYFLMITLAQAMLVYFYVNQDRIFAGGHSGINGVRPPSVGLLDLADPTAFYYMTLIIAVLAYLGLHYLLRSPFGLALQGIRDNTQRMRSLGYKTSAHRVAAFTLAGFIAALGGIIGVWYNGSISPGSIDLTRTINVLVIAVLGGIGYLEGAFVGALFFTLVTNFASSYTDRFNTVIGIAFLLVALFFPDGLIGLSKKAMQFLSRGGSGRGKPTRQQASTASSRSVPAKTSSPEISDAITGDPLR